MQDWLIEVRRWLSWIDGPSTFIQYLSKRQDGAMPLWMALNHHGFEWALHLKRHYWWERQTSRMLEWVDWQGTSWMQFHLLCMLGIACLCSKHCRLGSEPSRKEKERLYWSYHHIPVHSVCGKASLVLEPGFPPSIGLWRDRNVAKPQQDGSSYLLACDSVCSIYVKWLVHVLWGLNKVAVPEAAYPTELNVPETASVAYW